MTTIPYTYEIVAVTENSMEIAYNNPDHGTLVVGTRRPKVGETVEQVVAEASPAFFWRESAKEKLPISPGISGAGETQVEFPAHPPAPEPEPDPKLVGVEFDGVMCSATADDQNGLAAVLLAIQLQGAAFQPTRFYFDNGNTLVISLENYEAFAAVWLPFRQSFFQP